MLHAFLTSLFLVCMITSAHAACAPGPQPAINITVSETEPRFDYKLTQTQLAKFKGNADIPASAIYDLNVNAMSVGKLHVTHDIKFIKQVMQNKQACVQAGQIDIHIHLDPAIYIANELQSASCAHKEYLLHEMKHVEEDRRMILDYKAIILRNMEFAFPDAVDYSIGPVSAKSTKAAEEKLSAHIKGALQATIDSMMRERGDRQRGIDNTGEYQRLARACKPNGLANP